MFRPSILLNCIAEASACADVVHCTSIETTLWITNGDPDCIPFPALSKCFSDGTETFTATDINGATYTTLESLMANATPYTPSATVDQSVTTEVRNYFTVDPAAGTIADFVAAVIAAEAPTIQLPGEAAPVAVTAADVSGWSLEILPCFAELETGEIVPEGADFAFIGGLKATADNDAPTAGVDITTTFTPSPVAGSIAAFCVSFERKQSVKA